MNKANESYRYITFSKSLRERKYFNFHSNGSTSIKNSRNKSMRRKAASKREVATTCFARGFLTAGLVIGLLQLCGNHPTLQHDSTTDRRSLNFESMKMTWRESRDFDKTIKDKRDEFGACIMFKDDLKLLPEWLAYHYTVMPLRYLVVGVDGGNRQDPLPLLKQWDALNLKYEVISVADHYKNSSLYGKRYNTSTFKGAHNALQARQRVFIKSCTNIMRSWNVHWTSYTDIDEFLTFHGEYGRNETTMAKMVQEWQKEGFLTTPCFTIPRLRYGSMESANCSIPVVVEGEESLTTRRFVQHAKPGDFKASKFGKVLINVSALEDRQFDVMPRIIHRPYYPHCGPAGVLVNKKTRVRANHYTGGMETFLSRADDARRTEKEWKDFARYAFNNSCDDPTMRSWVQRFAHLVGGETEAERLLDLGPNAVTQVVGEAANSR